MSTSFIILFYCTKFGTIKNPAGSNNFVLSVKKWIFKNSNKQLLSWPKIKHKKEKESVNKEEGKENRPSYRYAWSSSAGINTHLFRTCTGYLRDTIRRIVESKACTKTLLYQLAFGNSCFCNRRNKCIFSARLAVVIIFIFFFLYFLRKQKIILESRDYLVHTRRLCICMAIRPNAAGERAFII